MTNARRSREKHREERKAMDLEQFEEERRKVMMENFQVYECSGNLEHEPDCDGECEVQELDELDKEIWAEQQRWNELGIPNVGTLPQTPIPGIPVDVFRLQLAYDALLDVIRDKGLATPEELDTSFKKKKLEVMTKIRENNEEKILESKRREVFGLPDKDQSKILMPTTRRTRLQ